MHQKSGREWLRCPYTCCILNPNQSVRCALRLRVAQVPQQQSTAAAPKSAASSRSATPEVMVHPTSNHTNQGRFKVSVMPDTPPCKQPMHADAASHAPKPKGKEPAHPIKQSNPTKTKTKTKQAQAPQSSQSQASDMSATSSSSSTATSSSSSTAAVRKTSASSVAPMKAKKPKEETVHVAGRFKVKTEQPLDPRNTPYERKAPRRESAPGTETILFKIQDRYGEEKEKEKLKRKDERAKVAAANAAAATATANAALKAKANNRPANMIDGSTMAAAGKEPAAVDSIPAATAAIKPEDQLSWIQISTSLKTIQRQYVNMQTSQGVILQRVKNIEQCVTQLAAHPTLGLPPQQMVMMQQQYDQVLAERAKLINEQQAELAAIKAENRRMQERLLHNNMAEAMQGLAASVNGQVPQIHTDAHAASFNSMPVQPGQSYGHSLANLTQPLPLAPLATAHPSNESPDLLSSTGQRKSHSPVDVQPLINYAEAVRKSVSFDDFNQANNAGLPSTDAVPSTNGFNPPAQLGSANHHQHHQLPHSQTSAAPRASLSGNTFAGMGVGTQQDGSRFANPGLGHGTPFPK